MTARMATGSDKYRLKYEETELRLGLPGGRTGNNNTTPAPAPATAKRGFSETEPFDLKLKLAAKDSSSSDQPDHLNLTDNNINGVPRPSTDPAKPPAKAQVVGWPPVRSFRKNVLSVQKNSNQDGQKSAGSTAAAAAAFVKVSMDGAPYLRKVDLKMYKSYKELSEALAKMFSFTIGNCGGSKGMKDFTSVSKLIDLLNGSDYVPTYEDKDDDWMLVGDVPWEMFVNSCKRLRIMKGSEAIGLAPRALEKCKNRS